MKYSYFHSVDSLAKVHSLVQRELSTVRSNASSDIFRYSLFNLWSFISCLRVSHSDNINLYDELQSWDKYVCGKIRGKLKTGNKETWLNSDKIMPLQALLNGSKN